MFNISAINHLNDFALFKEQVKAFNLENPKSTNNQNPAGSTHISGWVVPLETKTYEIILSINGEEKTLTPTIYREDVNRAFCTDEDQRKLGFSTKIEKTGSYIIRFRCGALEYSVFEFQVKSTPIEAIPSVIYITTPTSATASMWRIITRVARGIYQPNRITDQYYLNNKMHELRTTALPIVDNVILFNSPSNFNFDQDIEKFKFIINIRDPRDMLCNQYHWSLEHPDPSMSESDLNKHREKIRSEGIDKFVLSKNLRVQFENIMRLSSLLPKENFVFLTYKKLCEDFDGYLNTLSEFLNIKITQEMMRDLNLERTENLEKNNQWIGNKWGGSDVMPGRYKRELTHETIEILNEKYFDIIEFCEDK